MLNALRFGLTEFKGQRRPFIDIFEDFKRIMAAEEPINDAYITIDEDRYDATMKFEDGSAESYLTGRFRTYLVDQRIHEPLEVYSDQVGDEFIRHFKRFPNEIKRRELSD